MQADVARDLGIICRRLENLEKQVNGLTVHLNEIQQGDIDYLAMETGVDLDQDEEEEVE